MKHIFDQGEISFFVLPDSADIKGNVFRDVSDDGRWIVGHSETGHHHVMDREPVQVVKVRESRGVTILRMIVTKPTALVHLRSHDTHAPITVPAGKYEVRIAREFNPLTQMVSRVTD